MPRTQQQTEKSPHRGAEATEEAGRKEMIDYIRKLMESATADKLRKLMIAAINILA
jgi:hypothetical protein